MTTSDVENVLKINKTGFSHFFKTIFVQMSRVDRLSSSTPNQNVTKRQIYTNNDRLLTKPTKDNIRITMVYNI